MRSRLVRNTAEITAGVALGIAAMAVADTAITSIDLRRLVAVVLIGAVLAGWGVHVAVRKARGGDPSSVRQDQDPSSRETARRFRRG